ncbi:acetoin dehydrogenase E2 subunit dihydrolipoyllysine-residue acetyltransferase [Jannaschia seosinensis]|uniref:Acetoin dehydrogenase E2 subunit dihydrolipoyllysine-residue acetyltransferase n=1 Tax=Jannaschia seosinensis TaxID=313367 RepID=A0A0M7BD85_9RHOB|nr:alpha/beta hydrolase [Jannaschia seosinensis]CUH39236.1 acetoin dehydrogenase E2 subunit dihydrolipoyllysine-residue acetyltransferase [Jannaschia seosinensis]
MQNVLALHCMLASGAAWRRVAAACGGCWYAPDLPGHGAAPPWKGSAYMADALAVAAARAPEGRFDLIGHSYGGCLALRMLVEMPARIRSLVLVEPVMFAAGEPDVLADHFAQLAPYGTALRAGDGEAAARVFTGLWGDGRSWEELKPAQRAYIAARIALVAASEPGIAEDAHGILSRLPAVPPPTLLVTRRDPPEIVKTVADGLAARLRGAVRGTAGQGHMIPMQAPAELAARIGVFWNEMDPAHQGPGPVR